MSTLSFLIAAIVLAPVAARLLPLIADWLRELREDERGALIWEPRPGREPRHWTDAAPVIYAFLCIALSMVAEAIMEVAR